MTGVMTGETFALIDVIFRRTGGSCVGRCGTGTIVKPVIFVETSGMTSEICAPIGATCAMTVVTSGMTVATFDATAEGKFSAVPRGEGPRERRLASPAAAFRSCEQTSGDKRAMSVGAARSLRLGVVEHTF